MKYFASSGLRKNAKTSTPEGRCCLHGASMPPFTNKNSRKISQTGPESIFTLPVQPLKELAQYRTAA
jgi:hypothetical protein